MLGHLHNSLISSLPIPTLAISRSPDAYTEITEHLHYGREGSQSDLSEPFSRILLENRKKKNQNGQGSVVETSLGRRQLGVLGQDLARSSVHEYSNFHDGTPDAPNFWGWGIIISDYLRADPYPR